MLTVTFHYEKLTRWTISNLWRKAFGGTHGVSIGEKSKVIDDHMQKTRGYVIIF
jgi:hypothetical protein